MSTRAAAGGEQPRVAGQPPPLTRRRFSVDEYYALARAGILTEDERVELLDGEVVEMTPIGIRHAACVRRLNRRVFSRRFDNRAIVQVQDPVRLDGYTEPEPDVALLRLPLERYDVAHPAPEDVLLIVEVADTSLRRDRALKLPLYASAGIVEVWIVNVEAREVEVYRQPSGDRYTEVQHLRDGKVTPLAFPDETIDIEDILGPPPSDLPGVAPGG
jgi:Uma2 family endonuclease